MLVRRCTVIIKTPYMYMYMYMYMYIHMYIPYPCTCLYSLQCLMKVVIFSSLPAWSE